MRTFESHATLRTSASRRLGYILPHLSSYNGFGADEYINWEINMDKFFTQYRMCDKRKIKNAASSLTSYALIWWKDLCDYEEDPQTWKNMKQYMRDEFVPTSHSIKLICELHYLQQHDKTVEEYYDALNTLLLRCGLDESQEAKKIRFLNGLNNDIWDILIDMEYNSLYDLFDLACEIEKQIKYDTYLAEIEHHDTHIVEVPLATNLTHDVESEDEKANTLEENEQDLEHANRGNDMSDDSTQSEHNFDAPLLTIHAISEQSIVEPFSDFPLSKDDCFDVPCDKEELCDNALFIPMPQLVDEHDIFVLESSTCAENRLFLPITSAQDELKLFSYLNTLGYIEFDVLCNLNNLKEKLFMNPDFLWLSANTYHVIGRYNCKGEYMIHRVYICSNLNSPFVVQECDQLEGCNSNNIVMPSYSSFVLKKHVKIKEGEHCWWLPTPASDELSCDESILDYMPRIGTNLLQATRHDRDDIEEKLFCARFEPSGGGIKILMRTEFGNITSNHIVNSHYFCNPFLLRVVQVSLTHHEPKAQSTPRTAFRQEGENDEDMNTMHTTMHGENHGGGTKILKFESPNWRSKTYQVRVRRKGGGPSKTKFESTSESRSSRH